MSTLRKLIANGALIGFIFGLCFGHIAVYSAINDDWSVFISVTIMFLVGMGALIHSKATIDALKKEAEKTSEVSTESHDDSVELESSAKDEGDSATRG